MICDIDGEMQLDFSSSAHTESVDSEINLNDIASAINANQSITAESEDQGC